eukprot:6072323-Pleurochrysis_carterae.AAC.1
MSDIPSVRAICDRAGALLAARPQFLFMLWQDSLRMPWLLGHGNAELLAHALGKLFGACAGRCANVTWLAGLQRRAESVYLQRMSDPASSYESLTHV